MSNAQTLVEERLAW